MGTAARIRSLREQFGKSEAEIARVTGLSIHEYGDIESYDDELESTYSLQQVRALAECFGLSIPELVIGSSCSNAISLQQLPGLLETVMNRTGLNLEALEGEVGWELREFMQSPAHVIEQRPVMFLKDLAAVIGVEYARILPVGNAHAI
jgi:transcriptional regulator with XRE-family HTH domain